MEPKLEGLEDHAEAYVLMVWTFGQGVQLYPSSSVQPAAKEVSSGANFEPRDPQPEAHTQE